MFSECNLTLSFNPTPGMNTIEFKRASVDYMFDDVAKVLKCSGRYSPFVFKDDYRKGDNYLRNVSNCIVLDFDDGFTRREFKDRFKFAHATGTTKSHMVDKNGLTCERFRVIIPTETAIDLGQDDFSDMMREIFEVFPEADTACKDTARAYSGFTGSHVDIVYGELFDWVQYHERAEKRKELRKWQYEQKQKHEFEQSGEKIDWYRENWLSDIMKSVLKVEDKFVTGGRNNALYSYTRFFKDLGLTDSEIAEAIFWINNGELDELEIKQIFRGLRITI